MGDVQAGTVVVLEGLVGGLCRQSVEGELDAAGIIGVGAVNALDGRVA